MEKRRNVEERTSLKNSLGNIVKGIVTTIYIIAEFIVMIFVSTLLLIASIIDYWFRVISLDGKIISLTETIDHFKKIGWFKTILWFVVLIGGTILTWFIIRTISLLFLLFKYMA